MGEVGLLVVWSRVMKAAVEWHPMHREVHVLFFVETPTVEKSRRVHH